MAVFDASSGKFDNAGLASSFTLAHTCTGTDRVLVVPVYIDKRGGETVTGVTYNAVAMTSVVTPAAGTLFSMYLFLLVAPTTGANNIVVTLSAPISGATKQVGFGGLSYTACSQTGQPDSSATNVDNSNSTTNFAVSTTVVAGNSLLVGAASGDGGVIAAGAAGTGTTYRGTFIGNMYLADSSTGVAAGSRTLNWGKATTTEGDVGAILSLTPLTYSLTAAQGSYTLTGQSAIITLGYKLVAAVGTFALTGFATAFSIVIRWLTQTHSSTSFTNGTKHSSTWTNATKDSTTFTNQPKS